MGLDSILEEMTYYASGRPKKETEKKAKKTKEKADDIEKAMDDMDALFAELFSDSNDKKSDLEKRSHQKEEKETNVWRKKTDGIWDGAETGDREDESEDDGNLYNATEDISLLFERGPKRGIFHGIFTSSVFITKKYREIRWDEYFKLRIGFRMDSDSSLDYFGRSKLMETVSEEMAVFWDKGPQVHNFLPYVWEKEKNRRK